MNNIIIRPETEKDYRTVEELTREALWRPSQEEFYIYRNSSVVR